MSERFIAFAVRCNIFVILQRGMNDSSFIWIHVVDIQYDELNNTMNIDLSGDEMGVLIGKRGQTLDSLQYPSLRIHFSKSPLPYPERKILLLL